jgi:SpoU rRNA methylase family enzyme
MNRFFLETNVAGAARAAQCGVPQLQRVTEKPGGGVSNREILNVKI